jgi:hypothetical protein
MKEQFPPKKKEKESQKKGMKVERKDSPLKERKSLFYSREER